MTAANHPECVQSCPETAVNDGLDACVPGISETRPGVKWRIHAVGWSRTSV